MEHALPTSLMERGLSEGLGASPFFQFLILRKSAAKDPAVRWLPSGPSAHGLHTTAKAPATKPLAPYRNCTAAASAAWQLK